MLLLKVALCTSSWINGCGEYWKKIISKNSLPFYIQQLSLKHPDVRKKLGLPQKDPQLEAAHQKELGNPGEIKIDPSKNQSKISVQNLSPHELVNVSNYFCFLILRLEMLNFSFCFLNLCLLKSHQLSIKLLAGGRKDEAMSFLRYFSPLIKAILTASFLFFLLCSILFLIYVLQTCYCQGSRECSSFAYYWPDTVARWFLTRSYWILGTYYC